MLTPQFQLPLHRELLVDLFAGGGGASTGIEQALGRHVDVAINHDPEAIALHTVNHPQTRHYIADVFEVDPLEATQGRPVGLLWASPSCTHFSRARGGVPVSKQLRSLGWVVVRWAAKVRPRVIMCENVAEWQDWGPVVNGQPCPRRKGRTFQQWVGSLRALGYRVEWRELRACDYGAPTIRKRLFLVARCDSEPIIWPEPTHGPGRQPYHTAAECIDWSIPCPSIFERKRPLAEATCRRIAKGIVRHVIEAAKPFIAPLRGTSSAHGLAEPLSTINAQGTHHALIAPTLIAIDNQSSRAGSFSATDPLKTIVTENRHALVSAFLAKHYTGVIGSDLREPIGTVTSVDHHSLVTANLIHMGHGEGRSGKARFSHGVRDIREPLNTITASGGTAGLVHAFLLKYYGNEQDGTQINEPLHTIPTHDRFGLVLVHGQPYQIVDIGLRMLAPHELYQAQGFPPNYIINHRDDGSPITKTAQVRMCGNSVCPPVAQALVAANYSSAEMLQAA
ncbi:DNA (cytosine-5-)-methyltransferase [Lysobacteraceae bacterium NML75-0749]|nr:DNA (cytosine-5-)-methyltransferase [Xanthomonadaceae bacterium NML75-0749]